MELLGFAAALDLWPPSQRHPYAAKSGIAFSFEQPWHSARGQQMQNASVDDLLDLIQQEIQLREEADEIPTAEEYGRRFRALADTNHFPKR